MGSKDDLFDRDPNSINSHIQVNFSDVFGEVDGTHSAECIWTTSNTCFVCSKICCYNVFSALCGLFVALFWGFQFACLTFNHVWCITPFTRCFSINCSSFQICFGTTVNCFMAPICESCSLIFHNIVVKKQ